MSPALADVVRILTLLMAGGIFVYLVWQSKKWHGPVQSARIDEIEADVRTIRGNLSRIERDTTHHYREYMQCNDRILKELEAFSPEVAARPQVLVANKVDLLGGDASRLTPLKRLAARRKIPLFAVSALKREGLRPLVECVARMLEEIAAGETGGPA